MGTPQHPPGVQCSACLHYRGLTELPPEEEGIEIDVVPTCAAYPDGVPDHLLLDQADHRRPYPGDGGILFEQITRK